MSRMFSRAGLPWLGLSLLLSTACGSDTTPAPRRAPEASHRRSGTLRRRVSERRGSDSMECRHRCVRSRRDRRRDRRRSVVHRRDSCLRRPRPLSRQETRLRHRFFYGWLLFTRERLSEIRHCCHRSALRRHARLQHLPRATQTGHHLSFRT